MLLDTDVLVVIPAYNEAATVGAVIAEVREMAPKAQVLVVDDASDDDTAEIARRAGARVISNIFNLGVGGAMRVGFRYARDRDFRALVQVDGDGQHDAAYLAQLLEPIEETEKPMVVVGARFAGSGQYRVRRARRWAMRLLAWYLSRITRVDLTDVTSGFRAYNREAIRLFARAYPPDYLSDTVESLVIVAEAGGVIAQVPVAMRVRSGGTPSQSSLQSTVYLTRVALMLVIALLRHRSPRPASSEVPL